MLDIIGRGRLTQNDRQICAALASHGFHPLDDRATFQEGTDFRSFEITFGMGMRYPV